MASFDEYRKKLNSKYGNKQEEEEKKDDTQVSKDETSSSSSSAFDEYRKKLNQKYSSKSSESVVSEKGSQGWQKYLDDSNKAQQEEDKPWWEKLLGYLGDTQDTTLPMATTTQVIKDLREDESYRLPSDDWSEEQKDTFGKLYLSNPDVAFAYAENANKSNKKAAEEEAIKKIQESATDNFWAGTGHTLGAIATAPFGLTDFLNDIAMANAGREIAPDGQISPYEYSQAVTSGISTHFNEEGGTLDEDIPIIGGKGWGDVYGLGTGIAQSAASAYTLGGAGTLISYFGQGAASGVDDALSRGATEEQAVLYGTSLGVFEGLAEKIGVDNLFKIGASSTTKELIKNVLKQAGAEGVEEGLTSFLGNIADNAIMQDKSNFNAMVLMYMSQGLTEEEAKKKAWMDSIEGIAYDAIGGFVSGGVHAEAHTGIQSAISNYNASKLYGYQSQMLIDDALSVENNSGLRTLAEKYKGRVEGGKNLTGGQINRLIEATDTAKLKNSILRRLGELGETSDVTPIADVLVRQAMGEELTSKDIKILNDSKAGHIVSAEMNRKNIASGGLANNWAESIGTRRIHPEAYNKKLYDLASQVSEMREATEKASVAKTIAESETATGTKLKVSENGKTIYNNAKGESEVVAVKRVVSTDGGLKVELEDGNTVNASDLSFSTSEEALMYEMVARMEVTPDTANEIISAFKPTNANQALQFMSFAPLAYQYGKIGNEAGLKHINLPENLKRIVYNRGGMDAILEASEKTPTAKKSNQSASTKKNGIIYENGYVYDEASANELQKTSMAYIEVMDKMSSALEIHVFESKMENGKRVAIVNGKKVSAPNGYFQYGNQIYIDINAGSNGEGAMLYTMSHEITHFIRQWNAKGFKELGDFLIAEYGKKGVPVNALIERQKDKIKKRYTEEGKALPSDAKLFDMAYEELVADAMSDMFADERAYEKLAKLKQKNRSVWQKLGEAIKALLDKLKGALGIYKQKDIGVAQEAHFVRDFTAEAYEKLQDLYLKAFVEAEANYEASEKTLYDNGIAVDTKTESASLMSVRDLLDGEQQQKVAETLATRFNVTVQEAKKWISAETSLASLILNPKYSQYLDYTADASEEAIKSNSDYPQGTVDFSNICKKRRDFTEVMNRVLRNFPNHVFEATDLAKIRTIMMEEGMEVACGICYVEDRRQLDSIVAQDFINSLALYRKGSKTRPDGKAFNANQLKALKLIDGDTYTPSIYELISLEGRNVLKTKNPAMEEAWVKFNNARGMQSVRLLLNDAEYKRQILKYTPAVVNRKNDLGGLRIYSFSDAEMFHLIDIIQVITDSATVGLSLQGYTKVNEYARAVKDTGEKLNRSLIPKGDLGYHIEDGKVVLDFDTVEGIDINHPDFFDNIDNPNIGNILIGINKTQIKAAMVSKFVDQIIPFHTGQSNEVLGEKGISAWVNYKDFQSERDISTGKKSTHQINIYTEVIQAAEKEGKPITNKVEFVNKFLEVCRENGLEPRFSEFLNADENGNYVYTEGYHKFLVDFKTFDQNTGEYLPQMPVKPIFDNAYITKLLEDYVKSQRIKDAELAKAMPKVLNRITDEIVNSNDTKFSDRNAWENIESIQGLEGYTVDEISSIAKNHIQSILEEYGEYAEIIAVQPIGSRAKGTAKADSDLDIVVEYEGDIREDDMFNMLNDEDGKLYIDGIEVDINPIRAEESGDIEDYLGRVYDFDKYNPQYSDRDSANMSSEDRDAGEAFSNFIGSVVNMFDQSKASKRKLKLGAISDAHAKIIESLMRTVVPNFSAKGYELWIDGTSAEHIHKRHGENGKADNSMATKESQILVPWAANHPDTGDFIRNANGTLQLSNRYFNANGSKAPQIRLEKIVDGETVYVSECVPDSMHKRIYITSAYKKGSTNQLLNIDSKESPQPTPKAVFDSGATNGIISQYADSVNRKFSDRDSNTIANDFLAHIDNILKGRGEWYTSDVVDYIADHPELDFIKRIYAKDKAVKGELDSFLKGIDNTRTLDRLSWFIGEAYSGIAPRWGENGRMVYPYQGAIRTFRNAIKRRTNEIMTAKVNGTNLGLKNHASSLEEVKGFFNRLNSNEEIGKFAEKVFATAEKLGVNIRFVNQTFMRGAAGNALGDMVEYKTSYFNDTAVSDQRKASTILHELIHSCTVYVMHANQSAGDVYYRDKSQNYEKIANMATRLNRIFMEIKNDPDFKGEYGTTSPMEMVAELANERFVGKLKQKNLWEKIVDWICELFGFKRGTSAYENAKMCVDFIIDNPEVSEYKAFAAGQRRTARREGYDVFGKTIDSDGNTMYSERDSYAPTFYSHMGKVIDGIKLEKMGANGVVSYLKGKGVKDEEIKWSGIEAFLEGKKSVTKAELQEFVAGSQLQIVEEAIGETGIDKKELWDNFRRQMGDVLSWLSPEEIDDMCFDYDGDFSAEKFKNELQAYVDDESISEMEYEEAVEYAEEMEEGLNSGGTRWGQYKLDGGTNYREIVFKMPNSSYTNSAMRAHWGEDAEGVLAHARIQDMTTSDGKKMLFIEEIQSDWHNEGQKKGYDDDELFERQKALKRKAHEAFLKLEDYSVAATGMAGEWETIERTPRGAKLLREYREIEAELKEASDAYIRAIPDAPFRSTYHEYVLKRLLRMAAEEGYDSIGWTTADIQSKRWSENYAEAYRIEYDQEMPKFLRKYGKKWGATVGKERIGEYSEQFEVDLDTMEDSDELLLEEGIKYDGVEVWSMDITDSMKDSALYEGQALYSDRDSYTVSNRTLLANALESVAQNDIERNKLAQYKAKIALIEKEQAKLAEIRAKAQELRFTKGRTPAETKQMRDLDFEATQLANRISTYDKQLLNLESTSALKSVLEREKAMLRKRLEQKGKQAIKDQKAKAAKTQRELLTRWQESRTKAIESRHKTEMRHKIKKVVSDLNKLLLHPTKEQHVPIGLQLPVAEALDAINMDTMNAEERVAYYNDLIARTNDPDEIDMLTRKRDFFEYRDANFKDRINALKNAYAEFKKSDDPLIRNAHNEAIEELIENTADFVGKKSLKDMSLVQLEAVYRMYKAILATVRNSNKMFKEGRQATVTENSEAVKTEVKEVGGHQERVSKLVKAIKLSWNHLKPVYAFERIGSKRLTSLFDNVRKGEETYAVDIYDAKAFFQEKTQRYNYNSWDFKKMYSFNDSTGNSFSLSLEQIMSLYAYSKREQADRHLEVGGFVFDDAIEVTEKKLGIPFKYEVNDANPYRLRKEDLLAITATLTTEQKGFIDEMQTYLSDVMGAKGNEVSLAMYDIKLYNEKNYFPLKTSRYFRDFNPEQSGNPMLRNSGFSKKTVPQAGNPIVLANFMDVWMSHVNDMSMYHSFVLPLEDFMRVYNYSSTAGGYDSVQQYIKNAYGAEANQYIEKLMQDINGGVASGSIHNGMLKMFGKFKKAAVAASLSTIVQQPTAIIRAMALINPKYFVGVPFKSGFKRAWEEMKRHAPITIIKEMGGIDVGSGRQAGEYIASHTYKGLGKIKGFFTDSSYRDSIFMWGAGKADELGWISIWNAVKREVASKQKLKQGTDEFFKACGERFSEVITHTQVYDSVFSRSGLMRDKGDLNKFATSFMGEPTTSFNMIYGAILKAKRGGSKAQAVREITSVYVSIIGAAAMASLIYALRDDDEDESYLEKWAESLGNKISSEVWIHNMLPYWRDIASILEGWDIERPDMSIFSDIKSSFDKLFKINEDGDFEWKVDFSNPNEVYSAIENFGGSIASAFGLPLKNFMRDTRGIFNGFEAMFDDVKPTDVGGAFVEGFTGKETPKSEKLYEAIVNGDKSRLEIYKKGYKTEDAYESAIRKALRENDPRITEAAQAKYDGNISEYTRIAREIIAEGNFSQDTVVAAINAQVTAIKNGEKTETKPTEDKDEATSIYSSSDINTAFDKGNNTLALQIIDDLVKTKVANGKTEKEAKSSIRSSMTSHWKPLYKEAYKKGDSTEMARIRKILNASGVYGTANEVVKTTQSWLKD